jgi:hypothetical protein
MREGGREERERERETFITFSSPDQLPGKMGEGKDEQKKKGGDLLRRRS